MGSTSVPQGEAPQQEFPVPAATRLAASPYFSLTTSLMLSVLIISPAFGLTTADDALRFYSFVAGAALGVQKSEQFLQCRGIGRTTKESSFALNANQALVLELVQVMG